jgi:hypothetical protein
LTRHYNIKKNTSGETARNGGQIAQEWLKSVGVDIDQFKRKSDSSLLKEIERGWRRNYFTHAKYK